MTGAPAAGAIARVVVPLYAASENRAAIDIAARLAGRANAPLHGIFVEDEDLLHLARLPFARQFTLGGDPEPLTATHVELHLRVAAEEARRDLVAAAERHGVASSFEIVRGGPEHALAGVSPHDLVVAGGLSRPVAGHFRVECRSWSVVATAPAPFLLVRQGRSESGTLVVLLRDRGAADARLLAAAARLAEATDGALTVIGPPGESDAEELAAWVAAHLGGHSLRPQIVTGSEEPDALHRLIGELDCRLLAVGADYLAASNDRLRVFAERFACDILVVR